MSVTNTFFTWLTMLGLGFGVAGAVILSYLPVADDRYVTQAVDGLGLTALYAGVFLFVLSLITLIGYWQVWRKEHSLPTRYRWPIMRFASLSAIGASSLLALKGFDVLSWLDGVLLVFALVLVDLSFRAKKGL